MDFSLNCYLILTTNIDSSWNFFEFTSIMQLMITMNHKSWEIIFKANRIPQFHYIRWKIAAQSHLNLNKINLHIDKENKTYDKLNFLHGLINHKSWANFVNFKKIKIKSQAKQQTKDEKKGFWLLIEQKMKKIGQTWSPIWLKNGQHINLGLKKMGMNVFGLPIAHPSLFPFILLVFEFLVIPPILIIVKL